MELNSKPPRDAVRPVTHHQGYRLCTVNANIDGFLWAP